MGNVLLAMLIFVGLLGCRTQAQLAPSLPSKFAALKHSDSAILFASQTGLRNANFMTLFTTVTVTELIATHIAEGWPVSFATATPENLLNRNTCEAGDILHECGTSPPPASSTFDPSTFSCGLSGHSSGSKAETVQALIAQTCEAPTGMSSQRSDANHVFWQENWNLPDGNSINMRLEWHSLSAEPGWSVLFNSGACKQGFDLPYILCGQNKGESLLSGGHVIGILGGVSLTWTSVVYPAPSSVRGLGEGKVVVQATF